MQKLTNVEEQAVLASYERLGSLHKVADELGHGRNTVHRCLKRNGVKCRKNKFTAEQEASIVEMYLGKVSIADILRKFEFANYETVRNIIRRSGRKLQVRGRKFREMPESMKDEIRQLWQSEMSRLDIMKKLVVSGSVFNRWIKQLGEKPRKSHPTGPESALWNGGRITVSGGYIAVWVDKNDPLFVMANTMGYATEHRLVMARFMERPLLAEESVHHVNGDREDNQLENLQLRIGNHGKGQAYQCSDCGSCRIEPIPLA